jgi:hypothetical protein
MSNQTNIKKRVLQTAETVLYEKQYVSPIDILIGIGWLQPINVQDWHKGKIPYLEKVIQVNLHKISLAMQCFSQWATEKKLKPSKTAYLARTKGQKRELVFSKSGDPNIEEAYQTCYISPILSEKKQQKIKEKLDKLPALVAHVVSHDTHCQQCKKELFQGNFIFMEADQVLCLNCAGFADLVFLPSGGTGLTRCSRKYSNKCVIVVKFSRARKRYERQGILITEEALQKAQQECQQGR